MYFTQADNITVRQGNLEKKNSTTNPPDQHGRVGQLVKSNCERHSSPTLEPACGPPCLLFNYQIISVLMILFCESPPHLILQAESYRLSGPT